MFFPIGGERLPVQFVCTRSTVQRSSNFQGRYVLVATECWMGKMGKIGEGGLFDDRTAVSQGVLC